MLSRSLPRLIWLNAVLLAGAFLAGPFALSQADAALLYLADRRGSNVGGDSVMRFDTTTGLGTDFYQTGEGSTNIMAAITGPDVNGDGIDDLYISDANPGRFTVADGVTGTEIEDIQDENDVGRDVFDGGRGMAALGDKVYIAYHTRGDGKIGVYDAASDAYTPAVFDVPGDPYGLAIDATGATMWATWGLDSGVTKIDLLTEVQTDYDFTTAGENWQITVGPDGKLYFITQLSGDDAVMRFDPDDPEGTIEQLLAPNEIANDHQFEGLAFGPDADDAVGPFDVLYVTDSWNDSIYRFNVLEDAVNGPSLGFIDVFADADDGIQQPHFIHIAPVPEPSTFALLALGGIACALGAYRRRWRG